MTGSDGSDDRADMDEEMSAQERNQLWSDEGLFRVGRIRDEHDLDPGRPYQSTRPCPRCGGEDARLIVRGSQNTVRCAVCNVHIYNAPKAETGERPRTARTLRQGIKPGQQARILDRDLQRCVMCGSSDPPLAIGHLLSVEDGARLGASTAELHSDANLAVMCEACNLGLNRRSVSPRSYAAIMYRLVVAEMERAALPAAAGDEVGGRPMPPKVPTV